MKQGALAPVFSYSPRVYIFVMLVRQPSSRLTNSRTVEGLQREGNALRTIVGHVGFISMKNEPEMGQPWSLDERFESENTGAEDSSSRITLDFYVYSHVRKGEKLCDVTLGMWSLRSLYPRRWDFNPRVVKIYLPLAESSITMGMIVESGKGWRE